jgi:hypothetical protein
MMSDDPALPPFIYEGLYPAEGKKSAIDFVERVIHNSDCARSGNNRG